MLAGNSWVRGCLGNKGVVRLGVIETMRGNDDDGSTGSCDDDATGEGVSLIGTDGWYCSMDEYSRRCDPQGVRGSGGVATRCGSRGGGSRGLGTNGGANGDGSTRGGGGGAMTGADVNGIGIVMVDPPVEEVGGGMKVGDDDLFLVILLRPWRSVRSPSRNFWSFKTW